MKFHPLPLNGAYLIEPEKREDERGFFARLFCQKLFQKEGLYSEFPQCNFSNNPKKGTLRGLHYQTPPFEEVKLVRCIAGAIYDCIVDLRLDSKTYLQWTGVELRAEPLQLLYVPKGFAHGFLTLEEETQVFYQVSTPYHPGSEKGLCYQDPAIGIQWPFSPSVISKKDQDHPPYSR